jgi:hypothetical protein
MASIVPLRRIRRLILIAATGNRYEVALLFHSDLVPPPIFPSLMTAVSPINSSHTDGSAGVTNASLRLVNSQNVGYCRLW